MCVVLSWFGVSQSFMQFHTSNQVNLGITFTFPTSAERGLPLIPSVDYSHARTCIKVVA
jgi:hypothetical protein